MTMLSPKEVLANHTRTYFGMYEMEIAVERVLNWLKDNPYGWEGSISLNAMITEQEKTGFIELVYGGWMTKSQNLNIYPYNGTFVLSKDCINRIIETHQRKMA